MQNDPLSIELKIMAMTENMKKTAEFRLSFFTKIV